ncbi:MAG: hypothetical protein MR332_07070 [Fusicatenibacter sp.]|nr:hypothetical protein [Fusicatenibacter sp.]
MLLRTYQRIIAIFREHNGYMNFAELQSYRVTVLQLREMEAEGSVQRFARGWYWCRKCGIEKPKDHRYIEIAKVNPQAVICLESACYLAGILSREPEIIAVATERTDRKKMEFDFPIQRFYLQNTDLPGEICEVQTEFGSYRYYSPERTFCDCVRMKKRLKYAVYQEIMEACRAGACETEKITAYAKILRALRNVEEEFGACTR